MSSSSFLRLPLLLQCMFQSTRPRASKRAIMTIILILSIAILTGCGLKGDLYLPETGPDDPPAMPVAEDEESDA